MLVAEIITEYKDGPPGGARRLALTAIGFEGEPDVDGWQHRNGKPIGRFDDHFLAVRFRLEDQRVRLRIDPTPAMSNMNGVVHGAFVMGLVDYSLFIGPVALGIERVVGGATIDAATQFYAPVLTDSPLDLVTEVMRATGRMVFIRGVIEQRGELTGGFSGTIRRRNSIEAADSLKQFAQMRGE